MEPLVIFGAGVVVYCGFIAMRDEVSDLRRWYTRYQRSRVESSSVRKAPAGVGKTVKYSRSGSYAYVRQGLAQAR